MTRKQGQGDTGDTGATGATGAKGNTGAKGEKGDTGATGAFRVTDEDGATAGTLLTVTTTTLSVSWQRTGGAQAPPEAWQR